MLCRRTVCRYSCHLALIPLVLTKQQWNREREGWLRKGFAAELIHNSGPEYGMGGQASVQGDVFSYGVLLLEMFTGVSPIDERFTDGSSLHKHVEMCFPDRVIDIIDTKMFSIEEGEEGGNAYVLENVNDCLISVLQCGLLCTKELPKERIAIQEVINLLNSTRAKLLRRNRF